MSPEAKAAQVERNRIRKAARTPEQIEADRLKANAAHAAWNKRNPERSAVLRKRAEAKRYSDPEKRMKATLTKIKNRAKIKGYDFNLTLEDVTVPEFCPVLGIPLRYSLHEGKKAAANPNSPSVDRIDSSQGYVKGNVRVISNRANLLKGDGTLAEIERIAAYMRGEL